MKNMEKIRNDIILKILENVPANMKPTEYIMRILNISKGSAYRRLNGTLSFSYEEIVLLAKEMDFSVDEVIYSGSRKKIIFEFNDCFTDNVQDIIFSALHKFYDLLCTNQNMKNVTTIEITNNLWFVYTIFSDNLFKFYYYKYLQQYDRLYLKLKMKDVEIPDSILDIKNKMVNIILSTSNHVIKSILDRHIFFNTITDIQYYYRRNFLEYDELILIAQDLKDLLINIERGAIDDKIYGNQYKYFVGQRSINTNSSSVQTDNQLYSIFYEHTLHPILCYDQRLCELHNNYLQSQKRQSILISNSNEELQAAFFEKQHEYLKSLTENIDLVI